MIFRVYTGLWLVLFAVTTAVARTPAQIDAIALDEMARQGIVGMAVGIVNNGQVYYTRGYGYADPDARAPVTPNTLFRWASISKTLTATAVLQLDEQMPGFSLSDRVSEHVPYWPNAGNKGRIRIWQLLSNRSGIIHYNQKKHCYLNRAPRYDRREHASEFYDARQSVAVFSGQPLCFDPGTHYKYSTFGYSLLGAAVESAAGMPYADWIENRIRRPLAMESLRQGTGTRIGFEHDGYRTGKVYEDNAAWKLPGGGWESDIIDLARFANGLLQGSLLDNTSRLWTRVPGNRTYGFGINHNADNSLVWHEGLKDSSRTLMVLYPASPEDHLGIVLMTNTLDSNPGRIARRLAELF
jgi:CubicO group peptidase (beta-lactamase class C family)